MGCHGLVHAGGSHQGSVPVSTLGVQKMLRAKTRIQMGRMSRASIFLFYSCLAFTIFSQRSGSLMIGNFLYPMHTTTSASITFGIVS